MEEKFSTLFKQVEKKQKLLAHRVYIVVEGEKTEYEYIKKLVKHRYKKIEPNIFFDDVNYFNNVVASLEKSGWNRDVDRCYVLCDFDRAYHKDKEPAQDAFRKGHKNLLAENNLMILFSNPSFEYWLYLHIENDFICDENLCTAVDIIKKIKEKLCLNIQDNEKDFKKMYSAIGEEIFFTAKILEATRKSMEQMEHFSINAIKDIETFPKEKLFTMVGQLITELEEIKDDPIFDSSLYKKNRHLK